MLYDLALWHSFDLHPSPKDQRRGVCCVAVVLDNEPLDMILGSVVTGAVNDMDPGEMCYPVLFVEESK